MPNELPITAVIPAYRRPDMLERALRSVFGQTRRPAEIIVVDDASGDDTGERATALGARVITHERNLGEGGARNTGVRAAGHDWIALLDCDDEWLPGHLDALWEARDDHVLIGTAVLVTAEGTRDHRVYGWPGPGTQVLDRPADVAIPQNKFLASSVLVRRDRVLEAGGFRDLHRAADLDMWVRLVERGSALAIPRVTALYHRHPEQISTDIGAMLAAQAAVLDAHADRPWCTPAVRRRQAGVRAWDRGRAALADGAPPISTVLGLTRRLADPQRAIGATQLLAFRFMGRRLASRHLPDGLPSVALLPGTAVEPAGVPGAVDLRGRTLPGAMLHLARRPTAGVLVGGRGAALAVRALGIDPIEPPGPER